jgi:hypothetical protein
MFTLALLLFALPPQSPGMPPQAPTSCLMSGCPCGCAVTGVCDCAARAVPHSTYAAWKAHAARRQAARPRLVPAPVPLTFAPAFPAFNPVFSPTFPVFSGGGGNCSGGG